ncbi:unnamed protein product [Candidula unifasciata]|uniref:CIDE-N domain-containing protein n=1 Tax=Candidula unifasciata TaxID=100452 RepID=A0A8S3YMM3_9EUPU|nr:unnamed protein product [Candidula unifasciata]
MEPQESGTLDSILCTEMTEAVRPCKVWNFDRSVKKSVTASTLQELIEKGCSKLALNPTSRLRVVLEEDGTEVDEEEYFSLLPMNTTFLFLQNNEQWQPGGGGDSRDEPDTSVTTGLEKDDLTSLIASLKCDLANIMTFSLEQLQQLVDHDTSKLAELMGQAERYTRAVQAACQRHLDEHAQTNEVADLLKLYHRARSSSGSPMEKKRKVDQSL